MSREYRVLEYEKIKEMLAEKAFSRMTHEEIASLTPSVSPRVIRDRITETSEAVSVIMRKGRLSVGPLEDIRDIIIYAQKGGTLRPSDILKVAIHLSSAITTVKFLSDDLHALPVIDEIRDVIVLNKELYDDIKSAIISENEIADDASYELKRIRRQTVLKNEDIRRKLNHYVTSDKNKDSLQDPIVTMRSGRYVIPVKLEHKHKFPGIVHDKSSSGATLFVEPQSIVNLNNDLRELEIAEEKEIERILAEFSVRLADLGYEIINNQDLLIKLDFIFAKGALAVDMDAIGPDISEDGALKIVNGRHPLIDKDKVVPISLTMDASYRTMVITGPNTGGKTVTLKTVGLFILMASSGLHIPASSGSVIPIVDRVFADIGDEQSIEQSLSTFSSHMTNIVRIVRESTENSIILLDELGAGTDPDEGAALAIAILDSLREKNCPVIATTHYTDLKKYAVDRPGVINASMEFDIETLSPTYKLKIGIPGKSNAFEISSKLGLPEKILEKAKSFLDDSHHEFEDVLSSIQEDRAQAERDKDEALALKLDMKLREGMLDKELEKLDEKKEKILAKSKEDAEEVLEDAKSILKEMQTVLQSGDNISGKDIEKYRKKIKKVEKSLKPPTKPSHNYPPISPDDLQVGQRVKIISLDQNGEVLSISGNTANIATGNMKINVAVKDLTSIEQGKPKKNKKTASNYGNIYRTKVSNISSSVDLHGKDLETAKIILDKYLDDAFLANLHEVSVVHGRGEGILRTGLREFLKSNKNVKSFRSGRPEEGGDGITIVKFKE